MKAFIPLLVALAAAPAAQAQQPQQRQLVLQLDLQRQGAVQSGAEQGRQQLRQQWRLEARLHSDGVLMINNPLDPDDTRRLMASAPRPVAAPAGGRAVTAAQGQALQAQMQVLQARCETDGACLAREAQALSQRMQAALQAAGGAPTPMAAEAAAPEERFLHFHGGPACGLTARGRIDSSISGSFADVQGQVPYTVTEQGEETLRDNVHCPSLMLVLDVKTGRTWLNLGTLPVQTRGTGRREVRGRPPRVDSGPIALRWWEAQDWLAQRLLHLDAGGSDSFRRQAGDLNVELRAQWSLR